MIERIFDVNEPIASKTVVAYDLAPSDQLNHIRSFVSLAKRNQLASINKDNKKKLTFDDLISGLPSPPVESPLSEFPSPPAPNTSDTPPMTPNTSVSSSSSTASGPTFSASSLSKQDIQEKLQALRSEKHRLFQLMKQAIQQDVEKAKQQPQPSPSSSWSGAIPTPPTVSRKSSLSSTNSSPRPSWSRPVHRSQSYQPQSRPHPYQRPLPAAGQQQSRYLY
ncbi:hypothetical protein DM01DRAFT_1331106 [Hesseltinella vesiculosa]|uniref:Uncharacterized protein n=1 Tax=Hesseltinella vesiculosa TaxID=101127 RepID=A0A1X2GY42_9FUNG|nr:hypothetical protein DM01DRAFT_1331106 [Hesseltinella vesiculosa]